MSYPDGRTGNPGGTRWDARRPVDGQDGYYWHYHSPDSDLRIVFRTNENGHPHMVGDIRERTEGGVTVLFAHIGDEGGPVGHDSRTAPLARLVALYDRAARLGAQRGTTEASAAAAGTEGDTTDWALCVALADFPGWWDDFERLPGPLATTEGGDDPTPRTLLRELGVDPELDDPDGDLQATLGAWYEEAFNRAWYAALTRIARERLSST